MKTHKDLSLNDYADICKLTNNNKITMGEVKHYITLISEKYDISDEESLKAIQKSVNIVKVS